MVNLVRTATAGIVRPPRLTSTRVGAAGRSKSHRSWWTSCWCHFRRPVRRVQRHDRVSVEVRPLAIAAVVVRRRRSEGRVDEPALDVDREERPHVRARAVLPALAFPRLHARLAGTRHRVERPEQLRPCARPSRGCRRRGRRLGRLLAVVAAGDDDVLVDGRRRDEAERAVDVAADARLQVDVTALAEAGRGLSRLRVEGEQPVAGAAEEPRRRAWRLPASRRRRGGSPERAR